MQPCAPPAAVRLGVAGDPLGRSGDRGAPAMGPAGNSSVYPVRLLSGGNRQHRQVNTPDQAIRTWHEGAGLASQLCPSGWPRDRPMGTCWVWIYSPSPNSAHQPDKGQRRYLCTCGASPGQQRHGNASPGAGDKVNVLNGASKMHPSLAHPTTLGRRCGAQHLPVTPISPASMGRGPAIRKSQADLPGFVGTRKNPSEKWRWRGPLAPGAAPPFDVGPGLGGLAAPAPHCHPGVNKD